MSIPRREISETDIAKVIVDQLSAFHWEVYQEVPHGFGRADIVATRGPVRWGIEVKKSINLTVIEQALNLSYHCHFVSVAAPCSRSASIARHLCKKLGIGIMRVSTTDFREDLHPEFHRKVLPLTLREEFKTFCPAGTPGGGQWTPFKDTKRQLIATVTREPGMEFGDLIKSLKHHYHSLSTAKTCLRGYIGTSVIPELRTETVGGKLCVFLSEVAQ